MARRRNYINRTMYNYSTSGGPIQEDFGAIGDKFLSGTRYINQVREQQVEKIQKKQEEIINQTQFPLTGNADVDKMFARTGEAIRNDLMNMRKQVGVNGFTMADFNEGYSNSLSSAKTISGINEWSKNEMARIDADESLSEVTKDLYMQNLGGVFNPNSVFDVRSENGSIIIDEIKGRDENGNIITQQTDVKRFMMNGSQDIEKFDPLEAFGELQNLYMSKNQSFEYSMEDLEGNPALLSKHVVGNPEQFGTFLENYLDNFESNDEKVIAFMYDEMGVGLGEGGLKHKDGRVILTDEQRKDARENFKKYLLDQVGVKEQGKLQFVPQRQATTGRYSPTMTISQGGNVVPRGTANAGYGQEFTFEDIAKTYGAGTVGLADSQGVSEGISKVYNSGADEYLNIVNKSQGFKDLNRDLYDDNGDNLAYEVPTYDDSGQYNNVTFEHFSLGTDLEDLEGKLSTNSGLKFSALSGIAFSMKYENVVDAEGNTVMVARPDAIRITGPSVHQRTVASSSADAKTGGMIQAGVAEVSEKSIVRPGVSNALSPDNVGYVLRQLYEQDPNIESYYTAYKQQYPSASDVQALYAIIKGLKS